MNERIKELVEKAGGGYWTTPGRNKEKVVMFSETDVEKFAELIVQECMMLVEGFIIEQEMALDDYQEFEASAVLKEHFGVKE